MNILQDFTVDIDQLQDRVTENDIKIQNNTNGLSTVSVQIERVELKSNENSGSISNLEEENECRMEEIGELQVKSNEIDNRVLENSENLDFLKQENELIKNAIGQLQIKSNETDKMVLENYGNLNILEQENELRINEIGQLQNKSTEIDKRVSADDIKILDNAIGLSTVNSDLERIEKKLVCKFYKICLQLELHYMSICKVHAWFLNQTIFT